MTSSKFESCLFSTGQVVACILLAFGVICSEQIMFLDVGMLTSLLIISVSILCIQNSVFHHFTSSVLIGKTSIKSFCCWFFGVGVGDDLASLVPAYYSWSASSVPACWVLNFYSHNLLNLWCVLFNMILCLTRWFFFPQKFYSPDFVHNQCDVLEFVFQHLLVGIVFNYTKHLRIPYRVHLCAGRTRLEHNFFCKFSWTTKPRYQFCRRQFLGVEPGSLPVSLWHLETSVDLIGTLLLETQSSVQLTTHLVEETCFWNIL